MPGYRVVVCVVDEDEESLEELDDELPLLPPELPLPLDPPQAPELPLRSSDATCCAGTRR